MADRLLVDVLPGGHVSVSTSFDGALPGAAGTRTELAAPLDPEALEELRWYLEDYLVAPFGVYEDRGSQVAAGLQGWGVALFEALFGAGPGRDAYMRLRERGRPTELVVRSDSPEVLGWPWELLWEPGRPSPLALTLAGIARSLPDEALPAPFEAAGKVLRVLMVIARPDGDRDVGFRMVARPLLERLDAVRGQVELVVLRPPTLEALERTLRDAQAAGRPFQVVHFDGHGVLAGRRAGAGAGGPHMYAGAPGEGFLIFEDSADGRSGRISAGRFADVVRDAGVPLVVLNACQSAAMSDQVEAAVATRLLQEGVGAVVAMGYSVYAVAAAEFMAAFYERLFAGEAVTAAVAAGRRRLFQRPERPSPKGDLPLSDWMVPVHYLRREVRFPHLIQEPSARPEDGVLPIDEELDRLREARPEHGDGLSPVGAFVGRDAEFYALERSTRRRGVVLVHGPGGSGKTELAKAFGRWWRDTGGVGLPDWVVVHSFEPGVATFGLDGALATIGLRLFGTDFARIARPERRRLVTAALRERRVLVVWDNFETVHSMPDLTGATPPLDDAGREELTGFLDDVAAPGGAGAVVITSRSSEPWLGESIGRLALGGLGPLDRAAYTDELLDDMPPIRDRRAPRAFGELLEWLDGHPLSMRLVLPHLATTEPSELLGGLQGAHALPAAVDEEQGRTTSLAASITYSFDHLPPRDRELLVVLALLEGVADASVLGSFSSADDTPARFRGVDAHGWVAVLDRATDLGLLSSLGGGMYALHPALPSYLASLWKSESSQETFDSEQTSTNRSLLDAYTALGHWLDGQISGGDASLAMTIIDRQRRVLGHFLGLALTSERWNAAQSIAQPLDSYWDARGLVDEARGWVDRVRLATETHAGALPRLDSPAGALGLFMVGVQANRDRRAGDLLGAERTHTEILQALQAQPPTPTWLRHSASTLGSLGNVAQDRGRPDEAEDRYRESLVIFEELGDRPNQAGTLHQLGMVAQARGRLDEAEDWYRKALTIFEKLGDRPGQALSFHQLGTIGEARGRLDEAEDWHRKALTIDEKLGDRVGQASSLHQLGMVAQARGRLDEAEDWYRKALTIFEKLGDRVGQASSFHQLGMVTEARGRLGDAEDWYRKSLTIFEELGDRPNQAVSFHQLGSVAQARGRLGDAEDWYRKSLLIHEEFADRPSQAMDYAGMGLLAERRGDVVEALRWMVRCVTLFDEFPHPVTGPGPYHLVRLTGLVGWAVLEEQWREVTGVEVPAAVREHIRAALDSASAE